MPNSENRPAVLVLSDPRTLCRVLVLFVCLELALQASYIIGPSASSPVFPTTGTPAFVQATEAHTAGSPTNLSASFGVLPVVSHAVIVQVLTGGLSGVADESTLVTDNQGNGYSRLRQSPSSSIGNPPRTNLWCGIVGASAGTFTVNALNASNSFFGVLIAEYSGTSCNEDQSNDAQTSTSPYNCGSITTRNAKDLVLVTLQTQAATGTITFTPPASFTTRTSQGVAASGQTGALADQIVSATATFTPTWTASQNVTQSPCNLVALLSATN